MKSLIENILESSAARFEFIKNARPMDVLTRMGLKI